MGEYDAFFVGTKVIGLSHWLAYVSQADISLYVSCRERDQKFDFGHYRKIQNRIMGEMRVQIVPG